MAQTPYKFNIDSTSSKAKPQHYHGGKCVSSNSGCICFLMSTKHTQSKCSDSISNLHHTILPKGLSVIFSCQIQFSQFCLQLEEKKEKPSTDYTERTSKKLDHPSRTAKKFTNTSTLLLSTKGTT